MARQRAKTTPDTNGRQARSLAPANALKQESKDCLTLSHEYGNGAATTETRARIEELAYELYLRRGRRDGYDKQDWLEAERLTLTTVQDCGQERL
jgi:hypothetical protein